MNLRITDTRYIPAHHLAAFLVACIAAYMPVTLASEDGTPGKLTLGVFPFLQTARLEQLFAPTASRLGEVLDVPVTIRSSSSMQQFRQRIEQQRYDLIFIQPFDYIRFAADAGYVPLASWTFQGTRDHPGKLNALFVVRGDSPIQSLSDLPGKVIVAPPQESAVAILGELELRQRLPQHAVKLEYRPDHLSCLQQVASRRADVCICAAPPLAMFRNRQSVPLRTVHESRWLPSSLFAASTRIPPAQRKKLRHEVLSWKSEHEADRKYLLNGTWSSLFPADDTDYNPVRELWKDYISNR